MNPDIRIVAVEPESSPVLSGGKPGPHRIQGIGAGFIPSVLDTGIYDQIERVSDDEAMQMARMAGKMEGVLLGISSGAALAAAVRIAGKEEGRTIVAVMPDSGDRYLSSSLFS